MIPRWRWLLRHFTRRLWVHAGLFSLFAVVAVLITLVAAPYIPLDLPAKIGANAVDSILRILASSMLAVTTFSLNVMVTAYGTATSNVTPRATHLLMEDSTTQNVLGTFIGSFLFSLLGIVFLSMGAYGDQGRAVLFIATMGVIILIVVTLLRWIDHLTRLGRVEETTERVEQAAARAITERAEHPYLGGRPLHNPTTDIPATARPITYQGIGYVQYIDINRLSIWAEKHETQVFVTALPGTFIDPQRPIVWVVNVDDDHDQTLRDAFTIDDVRSFDQDPRFGLAVLSEIASRALSPAVNDPGTAIDVIGRAVRILALWAERGRDVKSDKYMYPRIWVLPILADELFDDIFTPIARDGASIIEVQIRLQKALWSLSQLDNKRFAPSAARHSRQALARAEVAMALKFDKRQLRTIMQTLED
ncbi:MAG: DUF2254 domain-containing protein [Candidatus Nitrosoglobus sp.]